VRRTFFDVLERAPESSLIVSHACCRAVHDMPRNLSDEQLRALASEKASSGTMSRLQRGNVVVLTDDQHDAAASAALDRL
jgi:microsomal dipeptidase-like Zn-dependent dipeptidase